MNTRKLPYQAVPDRFRGSVKSMLNAVLRPAGMEIESTLRKRIEDERLRKLQTRGHWTKAQYGQGLSLDDDAALAFLNETCLPFRADYGRFQLNKNGDESQYFLKNGWFECVDAEVLYSVLRRYQPPSIVEVGSGFSTRLMRRAIEEGKLGTRITSIDPQPKIDVQPCADEYLTSLVEDLDIDRIVSLLGPGDILFIDSSHLVLTGGDVPFLFLEVLPRLQAGVLIHVHDIFIPFDYPVQWAMDGWGWNEQYLLHAFLAYNQAFEILWPARYMWEHHQQTIVAAIPAASTLSKYPSSFWLRKVA